MTVELVDDLDGSTAAETVLFMLDGAEYDIDLSETNAHRLRDLLGEFVQAARRTGGRIRRDRRPAAPSGGAAGEAAAIREWAAENGVDLSPRGRIPGRVIDAYREAQEQAKKPKAKKGAPRRPRTRK